MNKDVVKEKVISVLEDFIQDWGLDTEITPATKLVEDLGFDSIDVIQLTVALESAFGGRRIGFQELLMQGGRYVDDLSVGQFQAFFENRFATA